MYTNDYKVSVIMPTYNRINVISNAIDSVLNQSFQNFQLIICDDGSNDSTEDLINELYSQKLDENKIIYLKQKNSGVSKARNLCLKNADGDLIAYLDSDNIWLEYYLEKMVSIFNSLNYDTAYCTVEVIDNHSRQLCKEIYGKSKFVLNVEYDREKILKENFIDLNIFMHKAELYHELGGFNESLKSMVDWELILRYTKNHKPFFLDEVLAQRYLDDNLNNITYTVGHKNDHKKIMDLYNDEIIMTKLQSDLKIKEKTIKNLESVLKNQKNKINKMESSKSWKITKPIRKIGNFLRKDN